MHTHNVLHIIVHIYMKGVHSHQGDVFLRKTPGGVIVFVVKTITTQQHTTNIASVTHL